MNVEALIAKRLAAPKKFRVLTTYAYGALRHHDTETLEQSNNHAVGERRKIGRNLISRETGKVVRVVSVEVLPL